METVFALDEDQMRKLSAIAERLQGGNDKERDEGHRLWLILAQVKTQTLTI